MFIEIHNAIIAALKVQKYRQLTINPKTNLAIEGDLVLPSYVGTRPTNSTFAVSTNRRDLQMDRVTYRWEAIVEVPGLVSFAELEAELHSPMRVVVDGRRDLVVLLVGAGYVSPPDQSPSSGSSATFVFEVYPPTLRN